jgi:hypothetical protein
MNNSKIISIIKKNWDIHPSTVSYITNGVSTKNWKVRDVDSTYIFRNAGTYKYYVDYQVYLLRLLTEKKFPYLIPNILKAKKDFSIKYGDHYFYLYRYIDNKTVNSFFTDEQVIGLANIVAKFHITTFNIWQPKELRRKYIFRLQAIRSSVIKNFKIAYKKKHRNCCDRLLIKNYEILEKAIGTIKRTEVVSYDSLPTVTCYSDWNMDNVLLNRRNKIIGLIDYGGIFKEPRIFDIQNAIKNVLIEKMSLVRIKKFLNSYEKHIKIGSAEKNLIYSVMIGDCVRTISWLFEKSKGNDYMVFYTDLLRELRVLRWLIKFRLKFGRAVK